MNQLHNGVFKTDVKKLIEGVESKLHKSDEHLKGSSLLYQAYVEVVAGRRPEDSNDVLYARAAQRAKKLDRGSKTEELAHTSTDRIFGDALVRALATKIEDLRREVFGSPEPPFETIQAASDWIKQQEEHNLAVWKQKSEQRDRARDEIKRLAPEYGIEFTTRSTFLSYQKPYDDHVKRAHVVPRTYLHRLACEAESMAKHTGLPADALVPCDT